MMYIKKSQLANYPLRTLLRKSASNYHQTIKKASTWEAFLMVPLVRIGLTTPPLPRVCSTTEPQRHDGNISTKTYQASQVLF